MNILNYIKGLIRNSKAVIAKMAAMCAYPMIENKILFIFLYLLGIINMLIEVYVLHYRIPKISFFTYVLDAYLICLMISFVPKRLKNVFQILTYSISVMLAVINIFCVNKFHAKIGPEILNVVLETNKRESSEFADKYINAELITSPLSILLVYLILFGMLALYAHSHFKLSKNRLISYILSSLFVVCVVVALPSRITMIKLLKAENIEELDHYINNHSLNTPYNNLAFAIKVRVLSNKDLDVLAKNQNKFTVDSCNHSSNNIIFIIGESYIKCHSQLYGYKYETTPYQKKRMNDGEIVVFTDVITPANLTSVVFKHTFSLHSIDMKDSWSSYPLFPVLYRKANYHVAFITNQFVKSIQQDAFNVTGGLFLNENRLSAMQFDTRNIISHQYDEELLRDYDSLQQYNTANNLIIFHLSGQHIDFYKRSPEAFKKFAVSDYSVRKDLSDQEKQIVADYDNATLYNDFVLEKIIERFENEDAIVIYMPDHGEECYDELHRMGRLPSGNFSPEVLRQEYRIPFWIWMSKKYRENHHTICKQVENAKNKPFMTDDISHMFLYLAGIKCKYYNDSKNVLSDSFDVNRKRLVEGIADFDKISEHKQ